MAEQLLTIIEQKLDEGETTVWGEIPQLIRGPLTFRRWSDTGTPCPVSDVYLVLGGAFSSEAHYRIQSSSTQNGAYDYIHRLSFYHLNPFTFRRMIEDAVMSILSTLKNEEIIISNTKGDSIISFTPTSDALELTCCLNGLRTPAWVLRFIPAIQGDGAPPQTLSTHQSRWLIVPPPRSRGPYVNTWEISHLSAASDPIRRSSLLQKALVCALYEAQAQNWGEGQIDFDQLLNRVAYEVQLGSSLTEQFEYLLKELVKRLRERHLEDEIPENQIDNLICQVNRTINDEDLVSRIRCIEENIDQFNPQHEKEEKRNRDTSITTTDGSVRQISDDEIGSSLARDLADFHPSSENKTIANGTGHSTSIVDQMKKATANGASYAMPNGTCKDDKNRNKKGKRDDERSKNKFFGIVSICLVLVVVGLVFVVAWLEDSDVMNLMQASKLTGFMSDDHKEF